MQYEYNGNLLEEDRINLVANEIITAYPEIPIDKAKEIAMLEGRISSNCNLEMVFTRLYNIMLTMSNDKSIVKRVYLDLFNILNVNANTNQNIEKIDYYYQVLEEIYNFLIDEREFPLLVEI